MRIMFSRARSPPALPPRQHLPTSPRGQASCTHSRMVRIWDDGSGQHYCHVCRGHRKIGWVYRCVEDHAGTLPYSDFAPSTAEVQRKVELSLDVTLSSWAVEAVNRGDYTPEQMQKLVEQKIGVKRAILAQALRGGPVSSRSSGSSSNTSSTANHSTFSTLPTTVDEEDRAADQNAKHSDSQDTSYRAEAAPRVSVQLNVCNWKCCHACHPNFHERAWQSLDEIVNEPYVAPPPWELNNRPVSDARILAKIGLTEVPEDYGEFGFMIDAAFSSDDLSTDGIDDSESDDEYALTRQRAHSFRNRSDFERAVRTVMESRAGNAGLTNRHTRQLSTSSSHGSLAGDSRSMLFMGKGSEAGTSTNATAPSSSQLSPARTVKDGADVEVADGVSVGEEGIDMGTADIVTQV